MTLTNTELLILPGGEFFSTIKLFNDFTKTLQKKPEYILSLNNYTYQKKEQYFYNNIFYCSNNKGENLVLFCCVLPRISIKIILEKRINVKRKKKLYDYSYDINIK